jgi:hypothetical protein
LINPLHKIQSKLVLELLKETWGIVKEILKVKEFTKYNSLGEYEV